MPVDQMNTRNSVAAYFISLQVPLPIEVLFDAKVDTNQPYDRTSVNIVSQGAQ